MAPEAPADRLRRRQDDPGLAAGRQPALGGTNPAHGEPQAAAGPPPPGPRLQHPSLRSAPRPDPGPPQETLVEGRHHRHREHRVAVLAPPRRGRRRIPDRDPARRQGAQVPPSGGASLRAGDPRATAGLGWPGALSFASIPGSFGPVRAIRDNPPGAITLAVGAKCQASRYGLVRRATTGPSTSWAGGRTE
jgi:hypothetical protein